MIHTLKLLKMPYQGCALKNWERLKINTLSEKFRIVIDLSDFD